MDTERDSLMICLSCCNSMKLQKDPYFKGSVQSGNSRKSKRTGRRLHHREVLRLNNYIVVDEFFSNKTSPLFGKGGACRMAIVNNRSADRFLRTSTLRIALIEKTKWPGWLLLSYGCRVETIDQYGDHGTQPLISAIDVSDQRSLLPPFCRTTNLKLNQMVNSPS